MLINQKWPAYVIRCALLSQIRMIATYVLFSIALSWLRFRASLQTSRGHCSYYGNELLPCSIRKYMYLFTKKSQATNYIVLIIFILLLHFPKKGFRSKIKWHNRKGYIILTELVKRHKYTRYRRKIKNLKQLLDQITLTRLTIDPNIITSSQLLPFCLASSQSSLLGSSFVGVNVISRYVWFPHLLTRQLSGCRANAQRSYQFSQDLYTLYASDCVMMLIVSEWSFASMDMCELSNRIGGFNVIERSC